MSDWSTNAVAVRHWTLVVVAVDGGVVAVAAAGASVPVRLSSGRVSAAVVVLCRVDSDV